MKNNKTTKREFELYCDEVAKCLKMYGICSYEVAYRHKKMPDYASCEYEDQIRQAWFNLATEWPSSADFPKTDVNIRKTAFHEATELFLGRLRNMLNEFHAPDRTDREIHKVIMTLQNAFFE